MTEISPRLISDLAQMAIKQAKILRNDGLSSEAQELAKLGLAMAYSSTRVTPPRLVPNSSRY